MSLLSHHTPHSDPLHQFHLNSTNQLSIINELKDIQSKLSPTLSILSQLRSIQCDPIQDPHSVILTNFPKHLMQGGHASASSLFQKCGMHVNGDASELIMDELLNKCQDASSEPHVWIWKLRKTQKGDNWKQRKTMFQGNATRRLSTSGLVAHQAGSSSSLLSKKRNSLGEISPISTSPNRLQRSSSHRSMSTSPSSPGSHLEFRLISSSDVGEFDLDTAYLCLQITHIDSTVLSKILDAHHSHVHPHHILFVNIHAWKGEKCSKSRAQFLHEHAAQLDQFFRSHEHHILHHRGTRIVVRVSHEHSREETPRFKSYFQYFFYRMPNQEIINGSIAFLREGRLLHIKGYRGCLSVKEVPTRLDSLNHGDVFILETEHQLFLWIGRDSNQQEQHAAQNVAQHFSLISKGRKSVNTIQDESEDEAEFLARFPSDSGRISSAEEGGEDVEVQPTLRTLYRIETSHVGSSRSLLSAENNTRYIFVARGKLYRDMLSDHKSAYMLDTGVDLMLWLGRSAPAILKEDALQFSLRYLRWQQLSEKTSVSIVREDEEYFRLQFHGWGTKDTE